MQDPIRWSLQSKWLQRKERLRRKAITCKEKTVNNMPQQININPEDTKAIECEKCKSQFFIPVYMLRSVSALISPSGREETIQVPVMACTDCGTPHMGDKLPGREDAPESNIIVGG